MSWKQLPVLLAVCLMATVVTATVAAAQTTAGSSGLMVVMDASGSMQADAGGGQTRIEVAREAGVQLVEALPERANLGLIAYGQNVSNDESMKAEGCQDVETIREVAPLERQELIDAIRSIQPQGHTPIGLSLQRAAEELSGVDGPRTIVLVSDGIDTCAPPEPCEVAAKLADEGIDLTVETVGFQVEEEAREQLECIAEATGGSYREAPDAASLGASIRALSLRAYRNYEPAGEPISGGETADRAVPMGLGSYVDEIVTEQSKFYTFDVADDRQFLISGVAVSTPPREVDVSTLELIVSDEEGQCADLGSTGRLGQAAVSIGLVGGPDEDCEEGGPFTLEVRLEGYEPDEGGDAEAPFPLELRLVELETGGSIRPPEPATPVGPEDDPIGGASYTTAPLIAPGTYDDNIRTGERLFWAVEIERGQALSVQVETAPAAVGDGFVRMDLGMENGALRGGRLGDDSTLRTDSFRVSESGRVTLEPGPVAQGSNKVLERPALFYVYVEIDDGPPTALLDYTLTVDVTGHPVPDTPEPTQDAATTQPSPEPSAAAPSSPGAAPTEPPEEDGGAAPVWWVLLGMLGLAGVVVAVRAVVRSSGTSDDGPPTAV